MSSTFDQLILDENPDAIIITTLTGDVVYWNNGAESIFGFVRSEVLGQSLKSIIIPADRIEEYEQTLDATLKSGRVDFETVRRKKDGSSVYVDVSYRALRTPRGDVEHLLSTQKDVTDLKSPARCQTCRG